MYIIECIKKVDPFFGRTGLTIGNFEGFHEGHIAIIQTLVKETRKRGLFSAVITFKQHPLKVLGSCEPEKLWAPMDKIDSFKKAGIDLLVYIDFSTKFSGTMPVDFLAHLNEVMKPKLYCLGGSFRFGKNNSGDMELLKRVSSRFNYRLISVCDVMCRGAPVSSTRIRSAVKSGNFGLVEELLGRRYSVYLAANPDNSTSMLPFITNCAVPCDGPFSGELEYLRTKENRKQRLIVSHHRFQSEQKGEFKNGGLYKYYFFK